MAELADALVLGASAQKACRFKSCSRHHRSALLLFPRHDFRRCLLACNFLLPEHVQPRNQLP